MKTEYSISQLKRILGVGNLAEEDTKYFQDKLDILEKEAWSLDKLKNGKIKRD